MSGKIKSRSAANADSITGGVSCDERILRDCHQLYTDHDSGELAGMLAEESHPGETGQLFLFL